MLLIPHITIPLALAANLGLTLGYFFPARGWFPARLVGCAAMVVYFFFGGCLAAAIAMTVLARPIALLPPLLLAVISWRRPFLWPLTMAVASACTIGPLLLYYGTTPRTSQEGIASLHEEFPDVTPIAVGPALRNASCRETLRTRGIDPANGDLDLTQCPDSSWAIRTLLAMPDPNVLVFTILSERFDRDSGRPYASVGRIDLRGGPIRWWIGPYPYGLTHDATGQTVFVTIHTRKIRSVVALDSSSLQEKWRIPVAGDGAQVAIFDRDRDALIVLTEGCTLTEIGGVSTRPMVISTLRYAEEIWRPSARWHLPGCVAGDSTGIEPQTGDLFLPNFFPLMSDQIAERTPAGLRALTAGRRGMAISSTYVPPLGEFWSVDFLTGAVYAYSPDTRATRAIVRLPAGVRGIAYNRSDNTVYVCQFLGKRLYAIGAPSGRIENRIFIPQACRSIAISQAGDVYFGTNFGIWRANRNQAK